MAAVTTNVNNRIFYLDIILFDFYSRIHNSGKIVCVGTLSEEMAKEAAKSFAIRVKKLGFDVRFCNYRIVNVAAMVTFPCGINISKFASAHRKIAR